MLTACTSALLAFISVINRYKALFAHPVTCAVSELIFVARRREFHGTLVRYRWALSMAQPINTSGLVSSPDAITRLHHASSSSGSRKSVIKHTI